MSQLRTIRTNFDRVEARRDRRYPLPPIDILLDGVEYSTVNWSLGGFLITTQLLVKIGTVLNAKLRLAQDAALHDVTVQLIRRDRELAALGFRFCDLSPGVIVALDRVVARRMTRWRAS